MILKNVYISNFGNLHEFSLDFDEGLTVLMQENGFGKSTLAAFIKAMFYGFPKQSKALTKNQRQKYNPWQGGRFGGALEFEEDGTQYRIERTFGDKPAGDVFELFEYRNGSKMHSERYSKNIGEEIFGLDEASYNRTTYMEQRTFTGSLYATDIQAKLGALVDASDDVSNYDNAVKALKERRTQMKAYKGNAGRIDQLMAERSRLQTELLASKDETAGLSGKYKLLEELSGQLQQYGQAMTDRRKSLEAVEHNVNIIRIHAQYQEKCEETAALGAQLKDLQDKYQGTVPRAEDLEEADKLLNEFGKMSQGADDTAYREALVCKARYENVFGSDMPADDEFSEQEDRCTRLDILNGKSYDDLGDSDSQKLEKLKSTFRSGLPSEDEVRSAVEKAERMSQLTQENADLSTLLMKMDQKPAEKNVNPGSLWLIFIAMAVLFLLAGGVMFTAFEMPAGGAIFVLAGFLSAVAAVIFKSKSGNAGLRKASTHRTGASNSGPAIGVSSDDLRHQINRNMAEMDNLNLELGDALFTYYPDARSMTSAAYELKQDTETYRSLTERVENAWAERQSDMAQKAVLEQALEAFIAAYLPETDQGDGFLGSTTAGDQGDGFLGSTTAGDQGDGFLGSSTAGDQENGSFGEFFENSGSTNQGTRPLGFRAAIQQIRANLMAYSAALRVIQTYSDKENARLAELADLSLKIKQLAERFHITGNFDRDCVNACIRDALQYSRLQEESAQKEKKLREFRENFEEDLAQTPDATLAGADRDSLNAAYLDAKARYDEAQENVNQLKVEAGNLQSIADKIPELQDQIDAAGREIDQMSEHVRLLDLTLQYLEAAKESLSDNYMTHIRESFATYLGEIPVDDGTVRYDIDANFKVSLLCDGASRQIEYFSDGIGDIIMFCMRLSLVDALYKGQKMFIILDDPFVNLDDKHMAQAQGLLQKVAAQRQIIYMTCNSSRV